MGVKLQDFLSDVDALEALLALFEVAIPREILTNLNSEDGTREHRQFHSLLTCEIQAFSGYGKCLSVESTAFFVNHYANFLYSRCSRHINVAEYAPRIRLL